jgi:hypothetical protein
MELTIHFMLKENIGPAAAAYAIKEEVANYKAQFNRNHTKYEILEEKVQPDNSILIKIKNQYNNYSYGDYLHNF